MSAAALLDEVIEELYARHTADAEAAGLARREYEERRGKVHQDDELWEPWSAAFVEWYVVERVAPTATRCRRRSRRIASSPPPAIRARDVVRALVTSQRSLFEVRAMARGRIELLDLLGGAEFHVDEQRALHGVEVGDVAELRLVGCGRRRRGPVRPHVHLSPEGGARGDRRARARDAREGREPARRDRSDRAAARPGHAVSPHGAGAGLRARLADHGMKRAPAALRSRSSSLAAPVAPAPTRRSTAPRRSRSIATCTPPGRVEFGFDGGAPVDTCGAGRAARLPRPSAPAAHARRPDVPGRPPRDARARRRARARLVASWSTRACRWRTRSATRWQGIGDDRPLDRWVPGDLALGARLRVAARGAFAAFLRGELTLADRRRSRLRRRAAAGPRRGC